ncbi:tRNA preQ1(34) S-adenosylmethionine ribosyltransferase-isomerase QueA [Pacificimonas sp. WHA3]|uniref:S-adenosylmethionine:tRNA ribosyltransferase-isomerase n=1 Tax=Pacificimonas pallii TaxID=2827236 RepID=A0ABS6SFR4_9SPHN|nr:tRNA preQ1(34) S-adenosylmethionine ribosyltransferase-isomerase QueA [Pacificimonas pallii]MBV7257242.1 tRNA preQ1(34) S-adenosylmethionine ribosyltransferase-isomerase QueA [Pacificimonas pallii]
MRVDDFDFDLPEERIALRPVVPRDAAKMLVVRPDAFEDRGVRDLPACLAPGDTLVFNDTRVIPAQLAGRRGEAGIGVTLHKREAQDEWLAFVRNARRLRIGDRVVFSATLCADVLAKSEGGEVHFRFLSDGPVEAEIAAAGTMPLPPYIASKRPTDARDADDYQTMFARRDGAVAAPTASLHFTDTLMADLKARGVHVETLTLHVGAGTFLPVKVDDTEDHKMHSEWGELSAAAAARLNERRARGGRIIPAGTTSLRVLESAAREDGTLAAFCGDTDIFITPGYRFRTIDGLLTNFHLPRSTLFMLVSALMGKTRMHAAYAYAIRNKYRFYSYGDASLLLPN